jgi:hypothetical protein
VNVEIDMNGEMNVEIPPAAAVDWPTRRAPGALATTGPRRPSPLAT